MDSRLFTRFTSRRNIYPSFFCKPPWWALDSVWISRRFSASSLWIYLHRVQHQLRHAVGLGTGKTAGRKAKDLVSHHGGHGDLRRQRHCRDRAHHQRQRRGDCRLSWNRIHAELSGPACVSGDWNSAAPDPNAVRPLGALAIHDTSSVVGATAKFGAVALAVGTTVKLARALWIVPLSVGTAMPEEQSAHPLALVHSALLSGSSSQYIRTHIPGVLSKSQTSRSHRLTVTLFLIGTASRRKRFKRSAFGRCCKEFFCGP